MSRPPFVIRKVSDIPSRAWKKLNIKDINLGDISSHVFSLTQIELPPNSILPTIRHLKTMEFVYVLEGSAKATLNSIVVALGPGDYLFMEAGVWHSFTSGKKGVKALSFYFPAINTANPDVEIRENKVSGSLTFGKEEKCRTTRGG